MTKLAETVAWAGSVDIKPLRMAVRKASSSPLRAIGSGGSLTAAHALVSFHQHFTGRLATVATPLEAREERLESETGTWLLSAGGGNVDILAVAEETILREPRQIGVLCGKPGSALANLCQAHPFVDLLLYQLPTGKDGFLATNSLLGFTALLLRAYTAESCGEDKWNRTLGMLGPFLHDGSNTTLRWAEATALLWSRPTTIVLFGPTSRIGALDIESKFTEAALGNVQLADYRNFAHGRHHWLAKRGGESSILALVSEADRKLAERTLSLIPKEIPLARLDLPGDPGAAAISSLIASLRVTGWAGSARGIDPGQPGVPLFGRKLYNLSLPKGGRREPIKLLTSRDAAAIRRKTGISPAALSASGELRFWQDSLNKFRSALLRREFPAIILDYDGTVIDPRHREAPPIPEMVEALTKVLDTGAILAFATGRGISIREALRTSFPRQLWPRILIGYYNGAEIATLADESAPVRADAVDPSLRILAKAFRAQPEISVMAKQTDRRQQITLETSGIAREDRLWEIAHRVMLVEGIADVTVTRSSHSIDILAPGVSKLNVVTRVRELVGPEPILTIGDRGRWPGNDYELLHQPNALGVDEVSADPTTCWNLAEPGQRGLAVTLAYLVGLETGGDRLHFSEKALG